MIHLVKTFSTRARDILPRVSFLNPLDELAMGPHIFQEAIYDFGASVNIMPKVIYDKISGDTLL